MQALRQLLQVLVVHAPLTVLPLPNHTELVSRAAGPDLPPISIAAASGPAASARAAADVQHCVDALASAVTARWACQPVAAQPGAPTIAAHTTRPSRLQTQLQSALLHACRVLSYSEADALAVLDAAMPVCCPASTVDALRSQVARGLPAAQVQVGTGEATWWRAGRPESEIQIVDVVTLHRVAGDLPATSSVSHAG